MTVDLLRPLAEHSRRSLRAELVTLVLVVVVAGMFISSAHTAGGGAMVLVAGVSVTASARVLGGSRTLLRIAEAPCPRWVAWAARLGQLVGAAIFAAGAVVIAGVWRPAP